MFILSLLSAFERISASYDNIRRMSVISFDDFGAGINTTIEGSSNDNTMQNSSTIYIDKSPVVSRKNSNKANSN